MHRDHSLAHTNYNERGNPGSAWVKLDHGERGGMGFSSNGHFAKEADEQVYPYSKQNNENDYLNGAKDEVRF